MRKLTTAAVAVSCAASLIAVNGQSGGAAPFPSPWQLDRINQRALPLDGNTTNGSALTGAGVDIYIVDTGVRADHEQFGGRVVAGIDVPTLRGTSVVDPPTTDCDGHGTHVAALAAGSTVGVAPQARVISVRVLNCGGDGGVSEVVEALEWIRAHHRSGVAAVANLSLGVDRGDDGTAIEAAVRALIDEGVVVVVAAGNGDSSATPFDACAIAPGDVDRALTVGAVGVNDNVTSYSNFGPCVDLYAPGGDRNRSVLSAWIRSSSDYDTDVGTSMASPLVAGYAALLAQQQPSMCADTIADAVVARSTSNVLTGVTNGSPNKLLYLDVNPIPVTAPGEPSHVITSTGDGTLVVSWDPPCDGGVAVSGTQVTLLLRGRPVVRRTVPAGRNAVRITGLPVGARYKVVVKAHNDIGPGTATSRLYTVATRRLRVGQVVRAALLANYADGKNLRWSVSASSRRTCRVIHNPTRVVAMRAGTCKVGLRAIAGQTPVIRSFRITG